MTTTQPLTARDVARYPAPGMNVPVDARFSADSRYVTYLYSSDNSLSRELWAYDRESGREFRLLERSHGGNTDEAVSREEALRRERQRQLATGVTSYAWSETGGTLVIPLRGDVYIKNGIDGELRQMTEGGGCIDPRLSPDGTMVAFVREGDLYTLDLTQPGAVPIRLTFDASAPDGFGDRAITNGLAEFVAQEEMGRSAGFWWSPDGTRIAFEQVDTSEVPLFIIPHPGTDAVDMEAHRYPFAGKANARVRLGVVAARGGDARWLSLGDEPDIYLARVNWTPDGLLLVQVQSRDQTRLEVRRIDPEHDATVVLWVDEVRPWINLTDDLRFVRDRDAPADAYSILWTSERDGPRNLYLYDRDGRLVHRLNTDDTFIDRVRGVDTSGGWVYVEGWRETPLEMQLFRIPLAGGAAEQITTGHGMHGVTLDSSACCYVDLYSSIEAPPSATVREVDSEIHFRLQGGAKPDERLAALRLPPPRLVEAMTRDGERLHGAVYLPPGLAADAKAPVIVSVYGGPGPQMVQDAWRMTVSMRAQYLAQQGFIVLMLDNRGSARRGLAFEGALHQKMGDIEVRDQVDGVRWLGEHIPQADTDRIGVYGWSYGGYMALMCLLRAPDVFKVAVAGAPVTAWDGYDTHYTERYMGTPQDNPEGYRAGSVMTHVEQMRGALLLVHGMIDENVHFRHTGRLITKLIEAGKPYEIQLYPEERHSPRREEDRVFMEERIAEFFKRSL
ncbi:MAG: DPP IV N-terminal domain-containing protein [Dehalococcoidia bacterium]